MTTNESPKTPIYRQIAYQLIGEIQSGVYQPGDRLPSEHQLATQYQVHRLTIRHALN
ncbi:GntR family transcriptional regulator, partial [Calothrix rhizosoleniae]|uniref:GntR family transcriptional regulator n=1 Tax=Calothrix rhizosoleniae TaxID=888997 RepID=UPI001177D3B4